MQRRLRVCYFGTYLSAYPRNKLIIEGLRHCNVEVLECHVNLWKGIEPRWNEIKSRTGKLKIVWRLIIAYLRLLLMHQGIAGDYDVMVVGYTGHFDIFLARLLAWVKRRPLIFDAFVSLYNTFVEDRCMFRRNSLAARILLGIDRISCYLSDAVLLDTHAHIRYFKDSLKIGKPQFRCLWVGADDTVYFPRPAPQKDRRFKVLFIGGFIPLQGVTHILQAARLLEKERDICFRLIGAGQEYEEIVSTADKLGMKNIDFAGWLPYEDLPLEIASAQICLGIFGITEKAKMVIPNKVYMSLAMAKAVITGDSPAVREAFTDRENILLCEMGNPKSLARSIMLLKRNARLRTRISQNGYELFRKEFAPKVIGQHLKEMLLDLKPRQ